MKKIIAFTCLLALPMSAHAACTPLQLCARFTGIVDENFGAYPGSGDFTNNYGMCVYVQNDDESDYTTTVTGDGGGGTLIVSNGTDDLTVTFEFEEDSAPGYTTLVANTPTTFSNPETVSEDCTGNSFQTAKMRYTIDEADLQAATAGTYTGNINITISPD